jgi:hypothetical protein
MKHEFDFDEHVHILLMGLPLKVVEGKIIGIYCGPDEIMPRYDIELFREVKQADVDDRCELSHVKDVLDGTYPVISCSEDRLFRSMEGVENYVLANLIVTLK